ncbi:hypothetical protein BGZ79_002324 [Entomortierella chlamydospora]|nr:hypothetical protein BGZ79_002324 [Entomortierella chlamydospora]
MDADELVHDFTRAVNEGLAREINTNEGDNQEHVKLITRLTRWQGLVQSPRFHLSAVIHFERKARGTPPPPPPPASSGSSTQIETVGQRIKEAALKLESTVTSPGFNGAHDRKTFTLGASSILDLVDRSPESQLFQAFPDRDERDELLEMFSHLNVENTSTLPDPEELFAHWDACVVHATTGDLPYARSYLLREMSNSTPGFTNELWLLLIMVDTLTNNREILSHEADATDAGLLPILWRPLVSRLFYQRQAETMVRVKLGQSTPAASYVKKRAYYDDNNTAAFKTDCRVLLDDKYQDEIDLAAIVVASAQEPKFSSDSAKVLREAKEIVDGLVAIFPDDKDPLRNAVGYGIQISNLSATFFSLDLVAPKLYVAWPQYRVDLPTSIESMGNFNRVIIALNWFRHVIQSTSSGAQAALSQSATAGSLYQEKWVSPTWYTPTDPSKIQPIQNLFKVRFPIPTILRAQTGTASTRSLYADAQYDKNG